MSHLSHQLVMTVSCNADWVITLDKITQKKHNNLRPCFVCFASAALKSHKLVQHRQKSNIPLHDQFTFSLKVDCHITSQHSVKLPTIPVISRELIIHLIINASFYNYIILCQFLKSTNRTRTRHWPVQLTISFQSTFTTPFTLAPILAGLTHSHVIYLFVVAFDEIVTLPFCAFFLSWFSILLDVMTLKISSIY